VRNVLWHHVSMTEHDVSTLRGDSRLSGGGAAMWREQDPARGPSARAYLLILLGEYVLADDGAGAWTQTIIDGLGLIGFEERAARQAIARSAGAGWLMSQRSGRRVRWRLTEDGREYLAAARQRLFAPGPEPDWDGEWLVLLCTVPENQRKLRYRLRTSLGWAGFGSPGPGVWISPHPSHAAEARQVLRSLGADVQAVILHARLDDPGERHRLVSQAWDVHELDARYRSFVQHWAAVQVKSPSEAFIQRLHLVYEWRRLLLADPGLPPALLPADWSGEQGRRLLLDRHAQWRPLATTWWERRETEM
jgi:phenylacetic acid degradation operon negative regulatory protein